MKKFKIPPCQNHSLSPIVGALATAPQLRDISTAILCAELFLGLPSAGEEVWRIPPPAQRQDRSFSEARMSGAKQPAFCGAVARALLLGVCESSQKRLVLKVNARKSCVYFWSPQQFKRLL